MASSIKSRINLSKIDKNRIEEYNGSKYTNIAIVLFDQPDQWGNDGMIVQEITKEEREQGVKSIILGKIKYPIKKQEQTAPKQNTDIANDLPF